MAGSRGSGAGIGSCLSMSASAFHVLGLFLRGSLKLKSQDWLCLACILTVRGWVMPQCSGLRRIPVPRAGAQSRHTARGREWEEGVSQVKTEGHHQNKRGQGPGRGVRCPPQLVRDAVFCVLQPEGQWGTRPPSWSEPGHKRRSSARVWSLSPRWPSDTGIQQALGKLAKVTRMFHERPPDGLRGLCVEAGGRQGGWARHRRLGAPLRLPPRPHALRGPSPYAAVWTNLGGGVETYH